MDAARENVEIIRDDWGIAHIYGKTDADAVFGMIYAQAEDDFNRVERNYLLAMGRLAEAEGESEIYRDLRMKLFIDPADMKMKYPRIRQAATASAEGVRRTPFQRSAEIEIGGTDRSSSQLGSPLVHLLGADIAGDLLGRGAGKAGHRRGARCGRNG
jgi:hypothetical protein